MVRGQGQACRAPLLRGVETHDIPPLCAPNSAPQRLATFCCASPSCRNNCPLDE